MPPCTFVPLVDGLSLWVQAVTSKAIAATPQPAILATRARRAARRTCPGVLTATRADVP